MLEDITQGKFLHARDHREVGLAVLDGPMLAPKDLAVRKVDLENGRYNKRSPKDNGILPFDIFFK